jgi:hypothetical protein
MVPLIGAPVAATPDTMEAAEGVGVEPVVEAVVVPPPHAARDRLTVASSANIDPLTLFIGIFPLCNHYDFLVFPLL